MALLKYFLILQILVCAASARKRYDGFQVITGTPAIEEHVELLQTLQKLPEVYFWDEEIKLDKKVEILLHEEMVEQLLETPFAQEIQLTVTNENYQQYLDDEIIRMEKRHDDPDAYVYDPQDFNTYEDIMAHLDYLVTQCPPSFECEVATIGSSYEGRDIRVFRITKATGRQIVWMDSLIHAREWVAGTTNMRILEKLITEYGTNDDVNRLLDSYDFYVLPVLNPDGYVYTWTDERLWRKSRNDNSGSVCTGTDLNRNFDFGWGGVGSSSSPCSDTFHGSGPNSEPETQAVVNEGLRILPDVRVWMTIHTAAQGWLVPYGDYDELGNCHRPADFNDLNQAVQAGCAAVEATHGLVFDCGNSCEVLYATTGTTADYFKSMGIKYSYTPELRGPGFDPGVGAIQPSYEETWNGVVALINTIESIEGYK